jgi:hypothetical protein
MSSYWLIGVLPSIFFSLLFYFFLRIVPPRSRLSQRRYDELQAPEPLPTGVIGGAMWCLGIALALSYFALRAANQWWASFEGPAILSQYAPAVIWCFFPGFAALSIPWPLVIWYLRKTGRWEEADGIEDDADQKGGLDAFLIMKWFSIWVVGPIAIFTLLAIPIHVSISDSEIRVGHYASFKAERFRLNEARRLTTIDGYRLRNGTLQPAKDIIIDFADGRRFRGNQAGDGGSSVRNDIMELLIKKTGLVPQHSLTADEIPPLRVQ